MSEFTVRLKDAIPAILNFIIIKGGGDEVSYIQLCLVVYGKVRWFTTVYHPTEECLNDIINCCFV